MKLKQPKLYFILFFTVVAMLGIYSCNCGEGCSNLDWKFQLAFKNAPDSITVKIKRCHENSGFSNCYDSTTYTQFGQSIQDNNVSWPLLDLTGNDTTDYLVAVTHQQGTGSSTNYYYLTEVTYEQVKVKNCGKSCYYNQLKSCRVNTVPTTASGFGEIVLLWQ